MSHHNPSSHPSSSSKRRRRICLFGTSANPPTGKGGHVGIVRYLASLSFPTTPMLQENNQQIYDCSYNSSPQQTSNQSTSRFHEIRVLPVYKHMFDVSKTYLCFKVLYHDIITFFCIILTQFYAKYLQEKRENQASYDDRLAMCQLAFQDIPNVVVSDDERRCFHWVAKKHGM
jgi:Nicotinic acid mononucleotide adenylyltransferase